MTSLNSGGSQLEVNRGDDVQKLYFILIILVFILSLLFAVLIWHQTIKFEKKALAAKRAKEEYLNQLRLEEEIKKAEEQQRQKEEQRSTDQNPDLEADTDSGNKQ
jgi:predicted Holliday junction resolvase-like endonuclease